MARILWKNQCFRGKRPRNLPLPWGNEPGPEPGPREWRVSYVKTNVFVAGEPEIRHSHGGARPAPAGHRGGESVRMPPRPPCGVISCYLLIPLETYQSSLLGKNPPAHFAQGPGDKWNTKTRTLGPGPFRENEKNWLILRFSLAFFFTGPLQAGAGGPLEHQNENPVPAPFPGKGPP